MRFKDFLTEKAIVKWETDNIDVQKAVDLLNTHCKKGLMAVTNGGLLYRGMRGEKSEALVIDSSTGERTSKDTNNLYQLMMDNSSSLNGYAKRSKSLICSTSLSEAESYGAAMVIIPFDDTEIVCSDNDDFFSSNAGKLVDFQEMDTMSSLVETVLKRSGLKSRASQFTSIDDLDKFVAANKEEFVKNWEEYFGAKIDSYLQGDKPFTALCGVIMTPKNLNLFKEQFGSALNFNTECWFSGKCVAINAHIFAEILTELKKRKFKINTRILREFTSRLNRLEK